MPLPIRHPEWDKLVEQRDALHAQIASTLADIHAVDDERPVVLGRYAAAFGDRLMRLHGLEIDSARLKREIELVQAALNSGREVDYQTIHDTLEQEFAEWQARLEAEAERLDAHRRSLDHLLDPATSLALRKTFRILVRRLHPDLHPDRTPAQAELWHRVTAAYEVRDMDELSALEILTREVGDVLPPDSLEALRETVSSLRPRLDRLLLNLAETRRQWPFDQVPLLDDSKATASEQTALDVRIAAATALRDERKQWLGLLLDHRKETP